MRTQQFLLSIAVAASSLAASDAAFAQGRPNGDTLRAAVIPGAPPAAAGVRPSTGPRPYREIITPKAVTDAGLFNVHKVDDRFFFEIPDSLMSREILVVARISKAAADGRASFAGYAGDQIGESVISFERGPNNKVFMKQLSFRERSSDSSRDGMYRAVKNSNVQPIVAAFDVKSLAKDSAGVVVDMTDFINGDNDIFFFRGDSKRTFGLGSALPDRSYIQTVKSFPINIEIKTVKTYTKSGAGGGIPGLPVAPSSGAPATYELNTSLVVLPKVPMKPRYFDSRVGFFASGFIDFDVNGQGVENRALIWRWRLEPKPQDMEKYRRGELVEPIKPIVIYIDPATPKKWVPYLIQGVNDWQAAFEKAGFKNAIYAKEAPLNDPEWSLEDARHSAIVYKPSDIENASGPSVKDPRSGEIMETHINWYHNVMSLLYKWYFIQCSPLDPRARKPQMDDALMGELVRFVSSHEVGHTLGLRHNFGSSGMVPVENLRNKAWVEANGHTPSIMDYARFNYVAQPEDNIAPKGLFPRIGAYDKWAIQWGYSYLPQFGTADAEKAYLNNWIIDSLKKNPMLWFGTETDPADPRGQNEDLGDNSMKASAYGIKNLQRIVPNLINWTKESNEGYAKPAEMYGEVVGQYSRYVGHVTKNIGGTYTTPKTVEQSGAIYETVPKARQKEAMAFLQEQVFTTPTWLIDPNFASVTGAANGSEVTRVQDQALGRVLSSATLTRMVQAEMVSGSNVYTASEMLSDLKKGIWSELPARKSISMQRRNLQKAYTERIIGLLAPPTTATVSFGGQNFTTTSGLSKTTDAFSVVKAHAKSLASEVKAAAAVAPDAATRAHLQDLSDRMNDALYPKK
jgi:hypothetical protein